MRPPRRLRASRTVTRRPVEASRRAAASPAAPAPSTTTSAIHLVSFQAQTGLVEKRNACRSLEQNSLVQQEGQALYPRPSGFRLGPHQPPADEETCLICVSVGQSQGSC